MTAMTLKPSIKFTLDFAPIVCFVVAYYVFGLLAATATLMVVTFITLGVIYWAERKLAMAPLITGVLVGVFGGITLITQDEYFIKIKPTIVNLILASVLIGGVMMKKSLIKYVLEMAFQLDEEGWRGLSLRWGLFFIFLAVVNEVVWRHSTTAFWVGFKLYGMFTMNILFWLAHAPYIQKHMIKTPDQPQS